MDRSAKCPGCGNAITVPAAGGAVKCPSCGATLRLKPRPPEAAPPAAAVPESPGESEAPEPVPGPAEPKAPRGKKRTRPAKAATGKPHKSGPVGVVPAVALSLFLLLLVGGSVIWVLTGQPGKPGPGGDGGDGADAPGQTDGVSAAAEPTPYDPIPWSVPPAGAAPVIETDRIDLALPDPNKSDNARPGYVSVMVPVPGGRGDYLSFRGDPNRGELQILRGRFDPKAGVMLDQQVVEDIVPFRSARPNVSAEVPTAALAPDGTLAAWRADGLPRFGTPIKDGKVTFWDKGSAQPRPAAGPACTLDHWFDWAADGKLLLVHGGKLTLWDAAAGKPVFEVGQGLRRPVVLAPSRQWVVVRVGGPDPRAPGYLEVYDTATGQARGRFGAGLMTGLVLSPDGTRLAGVQPNNPFEPGAGIEVHHWDMKTGERRGVIRSGGSATGTLRWWGPDHVLLAYSRVILQHDLFDLRTNTAQARVSFPPMEPNIHAYEWPPDGRPWWSHGDRVLFTLPLPQPGYDDAVFKPGSTVALEVSCGDPGLDQRATAAMTGALRREGFRVGPSDWKLRVTAAKRDTGREMRVGISRVMVPVVDGGIELVAPDGTIVRKAGASGGFSRGKYFVSMGGAGTEFHEKYDFRGRNPSEAMAEEVWDNFIRTLPTANWPRAVWKRNGKYEFVKNLVIPPPPFIRAK